MKKETVIRRQPLDYEDHDDTLGGTVDPKPESWSASILAGLVAVLLFCSMLLLLVIALYPMPTP